MYCLQHILRDWFITVLARMLVALGLKLDVVKHLCLLTESSTSSQWQSLTGRKGLHYFFLLYIIVATCIDIIIIVGRTFATHRAIYPVDLLVCLRHTSWVHDHHQQFQDRLEERTPTDLCNRLRLSINWGTHGWTWTKRHWLPQAKPPLLHMTDQPKQTSKAISFLHSKARHRDRNQCHGQQVLRLYSRRHHICNPPVYHPLFQAHLRLDLHMIFHQSSLWMRAGAPRDRWEGV